MTQTDIDAINACLERQHNEQMRMVDEGRCVGCGGKFLVGLDDAWVADRYGSGFYMCFWCWEKEVYDPYDPKPSKFNYGRC